VITDIMWATAILALGIALILLFRSGKDD